MGFGGSVQLTKLAVIPVVALAAFVFADSIFGVSEGFILNPPYLLLTLNIIFWSLATGAVLYISSKSFLRDGSPTVLLISTSVLVFGVSVIVSAYASEFSGNYGVAVANPCLLGSSIIQVTASVFSYLGKDDLQTSDRRRALSVSYTLGLLFVGIVSVLALSASLPPFFLASGPTLLRQVVLGLAVLFFGVAFLIFGLQYLKSKSSSLLFYALSIALLSMGLFSAFEVKVLGDVPTWLGRVTLYIGTVYLIFAIVRSRSTTADLSTGWSETFMSSRQQSALLFSKMLDGFAYQRIVVNDDGKPVDYVFLAANDAFETITGLKRENVIGKRATEVLPGIEKDPADWIGVYGKVALSGHPVAFENYAEPLRKWYSVSAYSPRKGYFVTIFEDITERKKAEKEIAGLAKFPLENPAAVLRVDQKGIILFANPFAYDFLKEWQTKVGELAPNQVKQMIVDALASKSRIEFEANLGEETYSFLVAPIVAEGYANLYGRSITKRKKTEEALRKSEEKYKFLVETPNSIVMTADKDLNITYMNRFGLTFFGYAAEELLGKSVMGTIIPLKDDEGRDLSEMTKDMIKNPEKYKTNVHKNMLQNGKLVWLSWTNSFRYDQNGNVQEVLAVGHDISSLKEAEEKLRESKVWEATSIYTRNLIETSLDPLVTISAEGKITDVNKATEHVTGCSREELIGSDFSSYFTEPEKAAAGYKQVFTRGFVTDYPLAIRHKSGGVTDVLYNASVYRNARGQVQGVFAAARDVTERKKLEKKLQESERLAAIGSTAGMVGHDIRNPLQAILGDVYLLKSEVSALPEGEVKKNMKESLEGIDQNVQYVDKIVQDLQDYARPITPVAKKIRLEPLFEDVLSKIGLPENVDASCRVEKEAKTIVTDPQMLKRVLNNLVTNSVQAMPKGGKLDIRAFKYVGDTVITVEDTGEGIPETAKSMLFTPLFTTKSKGQGFGLAVVKRMTEVLGGTVSFESELGKGTKFIIRFPL